MCQSQNIVSNTIYLPKQSKLEAAKPALQETLSATILSADKCINGQQLQYQEEVGNLWKSTGTTTYNTQNKDK